MATVQHFIQLTGDDAKTSSPPKYPLFVTWKKKSSASTPDSSAQWRLRGCIGTFGAKELSKGLKEYAIISALQDTRFSPITKAEIPLLRVEVSLLINFQQAKDYRDWNPGQHGIQIEFVSSSYTAATNSAGSAANHNQQKTYSATYLPDVAKEQGWGIDQTIDELIQKSGYRGSITESLKRSIQLTRYESSKCLLTYSEYMQLKRDNANGMYSNAPIVADGIGKQEMIRGQKLSFEAEEDDEEEDEDDQGAGGKQSVRVERTVVQKSSSSSSSSSVGKGKKRSASNDGSDRDQDGKCCVE